jgi:hypothetical protein
MRVLEPSQNLLYLNRQPVRSGMTSRLQHHGSENLQSTFHGFQNKGVSHSKLTSLRMLQIMNLLVQDFVGRTTDQHRTLQDHESAQLFHPRSHSINHEPSGLMDDRLRRNGQVKLRAVTDLR